MSKLRSCIKQWINYQGQNLILNQHLIQDQVFKIKNTNNYINN
jgi:hypothetical protein